MTPALHLLTALHEAEHRLEVGVAVPAVLASAARAHGVDQGQLAALVLEKIVERDRARAALAAEAEG